jgi:hypothetical protein
VKKGTQLFFRPACRSEKELRPLFHLFVHRCILAQ